MNYRLAKIHAEESFTAAKTLTIPIRVKQPISRIDIRFEITKSKNDMDMHPAADVTKIELVDGSDRLFSLTGYEAQALNIYDRRCNSMLAGDRSASVAQVSHYAIDFGRYLWDEELAFDPTKFDNPQLKITFALTNSDDGGTPAIVEVLGHIFDEKVISPIGFLMSKEVHAYTTGAEDSYEYVDMPKDYPYRKMLIRGFKTDGYPPWEQIKEVKLDEDNDARIPLDVIVEDYYRMMKEHWHSIWEYIAFGVNAETVTLYVTPTDYCFLSILGMSGQVTLTYPDAGNTKGGYNQFTLTTSEALQGSVVGYLPNHCVEFPFGKPDVIDDWYDVTKVGSLRLRLKSGSSAEGEEGYVILQQLRRY